MTPLPVVSSRECVNALQRAGFVLVRQTGSHQVLIRNQPYGSAVVPVRKELQAGTLRSILRGAGLSVDEFIGLLKK